MQLARYAMMSVGQILLLAAAAMASVPAVQGPDGLVPGRVTRFVCAHCTLTGKLSSYCLFLNRAAAATLPLQNHATASDRSKWRPAPATSWLARGARPAQLRTSDISQKVMCYLKPQSSRHMSYDTLICISAGGVVVRAALQYA